MAKLQFSLVPTERASDVAELLLSSFFKDEPLGIALGLPVSQASRWLPLYIKEAVKEGVSWMAVDTETNKVIGASVNIVKYADPAANKLHMPEYLDAVSEPIMCTIAKFLGNLSKDVQLPGNPDRALSILFLNVEAHYGGRGIAQDLTRRSEQHAMSLGINTFIVDTTSEFSYKVYKKLGYGTLTEIQYAEYDDDGTKILGGKEMGPHTTARVLAKTIP